MVELSQDLFNLIALGCGTLAMVLVVLIFSFVLSRAVMQRLGWWKDSE